MELSGVSVVKLCASSYVTFPAGDSSGWQTGHCGLNEESVFHHQLQNAKAVLAPAPVMTPLLY